MGIIYPTNKWGVCPMSFVWHFASTYWRRNNKMWSTSRIVFEVTLFRHSALTRKVFYLQQQQMVWLETTSSEGEIEEASSTSSFGTLTITSIDHRKFWTTSSYSSQSWSDNIFSKEMKYHHQHLQYRAKVSSSAAWNWGIIICMNIISSIKLE